MSARPRKIVALCGGVGGAKLAFGLNQILGDRLTVIVNTGDDFEHLGFYICPDIDTVLYTLSGRANRELGWGRGDETWNFMAALEEVGGETWFRLGDRDLALHVERTRRLNHGERLTSIIGDIHQRWNIAAHIVPVSDNPIATMVTTEEGCLPFQHYFVRRRCEPHVHQIEFRGSADARMSDVAVAALQDPELEGVVICPSNPYLSIDPILSVPGMVDALQSIHCPVIAVSPLIGGKAVKGPTAKLMNEMNLAVSNHTIIEHYRQFLDAIVVDSVDYEDTTSKFPVFVARTLMKTDRDRIELANSALHYINSLRATRGE